MLTSDRVRERQRPVGTMRAACGVPALAITSAARCQCFSQIDIAVPTPTVIQTGQAKLGDEAIREMHQMQSKLVDVVLS